MDMEAVDSELFPIDCEDDLLPEWAEMLFGDLPGAVLVNFRGRVVYVNAAAARLLRRSPNDLLDRPSFEHLVASDRADALVQLATSDSPQRARPVTRQRLRRGDGRTATVEMALIVLPILDGGDSLVVEVLREPGSDGRGTSPARPKPARAPRRSGRAAHH